MYSIQILRLSTIHVRYGIIIRLFKFLKCNVLLEPDLGIDEHPAECDPC